MFFDEDTSGSIPFAERPSGRLLLAAVKAAIAAGGSPTIIVTVGTVPYGWDARNTGRRNKAGKPIRELIPNEAEQAIILERPPSTPPPSAPGRQITPSANHEESPTHPNYDPVHTCFASKTVQTFLSTRELRTTSLGL
jgi:hypothetical protein